MGIPSDWLAEQDAELIELVYQLLHHDNPDDEQLAELPELPSWSMDAAGIGGDDAERLTAAIEVLAARMHAADPRHRFIRENTEVELAPRLVAFYEQSEHENYQHKCLRDTNYAPYPLHVDFDVIADLCNPDFTGETIGDDYLEWANLIENVESDPDGTECYAHLAIHPTSTQVYLMEPSGAPELIAATLDEFLAKLS